MISRTDLNSVTRRLRFFLVPPLLAILAGPAVAGDTDRSVWYGSAGVGASFLNDQDVGIDIGLPSPIPGSISHSTGISGAVALGRELGSKQDDEYGRWRAEVEFFGLSAERDDFSAPSLQAGLSGRVEALGGFANVLYRFAGSDVARWWIGGGPGLIRLRVPDDSAAIRGCSCLGPSRDNELTWQIKLVGERSLGDRLKVFAELAYKELPGGQSGGVRAASTRYDDFGLINLHVGLRRDF